LQVRDGWAQDVEGMPHPARPIIGTRWRGMIDEVFIHQFLKAGYVSGGDNLLIEALDGDFVLVW
jgi:hypothetical protein